MIVIGEREREKTDTRTPWEPADEGETEGTGETVENEN
jgi:hypothetical protein